MTVGIYLGGTPSDGGTYQNALSLVAALGRLPREEYRPIGYCVQPEWEPVCAAAGLEMRRVRPPGAISRAVTKVARELPIGIAMRKAVGSAVTPLGRQLRRDGVDVCLYPNFEHYAWELATPSIGAIHDLMHRYEPHFPEVASGDIARRRDTMFSRMRLGATAVLTDSETGARQVRESYGESGAALHPLPYVPPGYVYEAADRDHDPTMDAWAREVGLPGAYLFYPAQFWTHKNHLRLLRAFARAAETRPDASLVLVGSEKNGATAVADEIVRLGLEGRVHVLGYVTNEQLAYLYRHARALVMPTFFGPTNIPPLEAFVLGCPVAVSGIYGMPEQLGDAALYFDPNSEDEIAEVCERLWDDEPLRAQLRENGFARAAAWGPTQHAERLREILDAVAGGATMASVEAVADPQNGGLPARPSVRSGTRAFAVAQALRMVVAFAVASLVARQLGAEGKGALALVQQVPSIMALVFGFGFGGVNVYYVGSGRKTAGEALGDSLVVASASVVLGVPLSWAFMRAVPALSGFSDGLLLLAALVVPVGVLSSQLGGILIGRGRPEAHARAQSVGLLINGAAVAALYLMVRLSVGAAVAASLLASVATVLLVSVAIRERAVLRGYAARLREAASYARRRYFTEVAGMLEMRVDIVMLGMLATVSATGVYSVAVAFVEMLWFIPRAAETPLLSRLLHEGGERGAEMTAQAVRLTVALEAVLLMGAALLLRPTVRLFFGPAFDGAVPLFWILGPGIVMNALAGPVVSYLTSRGHQYPALAAATVGGNIALNLVLVPTVGVAGAAIASAVTYGAGSVWLLRQFCRESECCWQDLMMVRRGDIRALVRW